MSPEVYWAGGLIVIGLFVIVVRRSMGDDRSGGPRPGDPYFKWYRYFFTVTVPPGIVFVMGRPDGVVRDDGSVGEWPREGGGGFTKISLEQSLPTAYVVGQITLFVVVCSVLVAIIKI